MPPLLIEEHVPLAPHTTFGIGGPARFFARITDPDQLLQAVAFARSRSLPLFVLGGGSNLLVADSGFAGLVLQVAIVQPLTRSDTVFEAAAGMDWDSFVRAICELGISGVECLAGIPGLVGGGPIQNIGAYGQEVAQTIQSVRALDLQTAEFVAVPREACGFGYRESLFNTTCRGRYIVVAVTFHFDPGAVPSLIYKDLSRRFAGQPAATPIEVYHAVREIRRAKGMLLTPGDPDSRSAGSFFKNPVVARERVAALANAAGVDEAALPHWVSEDGTVKLAAAWLVEHAGFSKGFRLGAAGISGRHSLALVNGGGATCADMVSLRDRIVGRVQERFGITLAQEPVQLGF